MEFLRNPYLRWAGGAGALLAALAFNAQTSTAATPQGPPVVRLSKVNGDVAIRRADSGTSIGARTNAPLETSDMLSTGRNGRAEMQFDNTTFVRTASNSQARISGIGTNASSVQLARGTVMLRQLPNSRTHAFIETPGATIRPQRLGSTRVTVLNNGNTLVTVRSGSAIVTTTRRVVRTIVPGQTVLVENTSNPVFAPAPLIGVDGFDTWNNGIDNLESPYNGFGLGYPNPGIVGVPQLTSYGQWVNSPQYGQEWVPSNQGNNWAPYQNGNWTWAPGYGYTWQGNEPWGWAPYHYGNWAYQPGIAPGANWGWAPGSVSNPSSNLWLPATVAFLSLLGGQNPQNALTAGLESSLATDCGVNPYGFGANQAAYGTPYGYAPNGYSPYGYGQQCPGAYPYGNTAPGYVGWVPLAPGEPISPWWGNWMNPVAFAAPTMISQPLQTVTFNRIVTVYRNFRAPGGMTIVSTRNFVNGRVVRVPITTVRNQVHSIVIVRHAIPFAPSRTILGARSTLAANPALFRRFSTPRQPLAFGEARTRLAAVAARAYRLPVHATTIGSHTTIRPNGSVVHARTAVRPNGAMVHGRTVVRPNSTTHVRTVVRPHSVTHIRTTVGPHGVTHSRVTTRRPLVTHPVAHPVVHPHPVMMHPVARPAYHPVARPVTHPMAAHPAYRQPRPMVREPRPMVHQPHAGARSGAGPGGAPRGKHAPAAKDGTHEKAPAHN